MQYMQNACNQKSYMTPIVTEEKKQEEEYAKRNLISTGGGIGGIKRAMQANVRRD